MSLLNEIRDYVKTFDSGTIRLGVLPDSPDEVLSIFEYAGSPAQGGFNVDGILHETPGVQFVCRGEPQDYETPRARLETVYREVAKIQGTTLGSTDYLYAQAVQTPGIRNRDEKKRVVLVVNFLIEKELSA